MPNQLDLSYQRPTVQKIGKSEILARLDQTDEQISPDTLDERFRAFHKNNPAVYVRLAALARLAVSRGRTHLGIKQLFEVVRWEYFIDSKGDEYRMNNSYSSRYARLLMEREPDLEGVFETRELHS